MVYTGTCIRPRGDSSNSLSQDHLRRGTEVSLVADRACQAVSMRLHDAVDDLAATVRDSTHCARGKLAQR